MRSQAKFPISQTTMKIQQIGQVKWAKMPTRRLANIRANSTTKTVRKKRTLPSTSTMLSRTFWKRPSRCPASTGGSR